MRGFLWGYLNYLFLFILRGGGRVYFPPPLMKMEPPNITLKAKTKDLYLLLLYFQNNQAITHMNKGLRRGY